MHEPSEIDEACARLDGARAAQAHGALREAAELATRAVQVFESDEEYAGDLANALVTLMSILADQGALAEAEKVAARTLALVSSFDGIDDEPVVRIRVQTLGNAARIERDRARYAVAEGLLREALVLAERVLGPEDADVAFTLNHLGIVHKHQGRFDDGEIVYRRALAILEANKTGVELASIYHNLGGLEHARGRPEHGVRWARKSVAVREAALGADHPTVAADVAALAALLADLEEYEEAETLYLRAFRQFEQAYGLEHYEIAVTWSNLAAVLAATDRTAAAEDYYLRALALKERLLGADHPDTALTAHNLATLLVEADRADEALPLFDRAVATFMRTLGPDHPHTQTARANRAAHSP